MASSVTAAAVANAANSAASPTADAFKSLSYYLAKFTRKRLFVGNKYIQMHRNACKLGIGTRSKTVKNLQKF